MRKNIFAVLILIFFIACSDAAPQTEAVSLFAPGTGEYAKLTPQDAQAKMSDDVIVLDVRTEEEFSNWRIKDSVLLPYDEVGERATDILPDKNQTVFVVCRAGRRSEIAARKLIEMGYTNVFDIGNVSDWLGALTLDPSNTLGTIGYNYFGGDLPPDIITPIDFSVSKIINENLPEFTFRLQGESREFYTLNSDRTVYFSREDMNRIDTLTITTADGSFFQEFTDLNAIDHPRATTENYGLKFDDWNFDGFIDISLPMFPPGNRGWTHYFWLWDGSQFARNTQLEEISEFFGAFIDEENNFVRSYSGRMGDYRDDFYKYINGEFILVKQILTERVFTGSEEIYTQRTSTYELIDERMRLTDASYEEWQLNDYQEENE
jgi:rhodanese-related sulfurtransferase